MKRSVYGVALAAMLVLAGGVSARTIVVRVNARDYEELYDHVQFKGTSIDIAGAIPGKSYDLVLDESDLPVVQRCGLAQQAITPDLEGWGRIAGGPFGQYRSYAENVSALRGYAASFPTICVLESIGPSYEGRYVYGLKIAQNPGVEDSTKPEILIYAQIHAREWATSEMALHAIDTLLRNYGSNTAFQDFINAHRLWIFPLFNVDGYSYDYPGQLWWRKNRQPYEGFIGTDMNRDGSGVCNGNPQAEWGALVPGSRSSHYPDDETYMGARGFFAPELQALAGLFKQHSFITELSLHSYSELVLWSYGHGEQTPDNAFLSHIGQGTAAQIHTLGGGTYTPEQSSILYPTNGDVEDWFYGWSRTIGGSPCFDLEFEVGTDFYQTTSDLDGMATQVFKGIWYFINRTDTVLTQMTPMVPRPFIAPVESSPNGDFTLHWTPVKPRYNRPDRWELEQLQGLTLDTEDVEDSTSAWVLQGAVVSNAQHRSGTHSFFLGNISNMDHWVVTKDPLPVTSTDDSVTFWAWYNLENNCDVGTAEVSLEGKEWTQLDNAYTGNSSGWVRKAYSLAPWLGRSVFIRLRAMSDDGNNLGGMYVDDVYPVPVFAQESVVDSAITDTLYALHARTPGRYWYRVRGHNTAWGWGDLGPLEDITVTGSGVADRKVSPGLEPTALGVQPTLFAERSVITYSLASPGRVRLAIFDSDGRLVRELANSTQGSGTHDVSWDGRDSHGRRLADGVYLCRFTADKTLTARLVMLH